MEILHIFYEEWNLNFAFKKCQNVLLKMNFDKVSLAN